MKPGKRAQLEGWIRDGREAEFQLANSAVSKHFDRLEERCERAWQDSEPSEREQREDAYLLLWAVRNVRALFNEELTSAITTGTLAEVELQNEQYDPKNVRLGVDGSTGLQYRIRT